MHLLDRLFGFFSVLAHADKTLCRVCGKAVADDAMHSVGFHTCTEQARIAYWRGIKALMIRGDPACPTCHGHGKKLYTDCHLSACECTLELVKTLEPPSRDEDPPCSGYFTHICKKCWEGMTIQQRLYTTATALAGWPQNEFIEAATAVLKGK